jgi:hypothetical protein
MRLTHTIREAFITSALNDLPKVDYEEKAKKLFVDMAVESLPLKIQEIYKDPVLRQYISHGYLGYGSNIIPNLHTLIQSLQFPGIPGVNPSISKENKDRLNELRLLNDAQNTKFNTLRIKLRAIAYSVNTRKALVEILPEFEKYLPSEDPATNRSLPTVINVVSEFKEAGWPKPKE